MDQTHDALFFDNLAYAALLADARTGIILDANPAACRLWRCEREDLVGGRQSRLHPIEGAPEGGTLFAALGKPGQAKDLETNILTKDNAIVPVAVAAAQLSMDGRDCVLGVFRDISERKLMEEQLRMLATTDPLTGVSNRRHFMEMLAFEHRQARRYQRDLAFLILDIDNFKAVNDTFGHIVGDEVIKATAGLCAKTLRSSDIFGRFGGEEFVAGLTTTDLASARVVAGKILEAVRGYTYQALGATVRFTVSIGLAALRPDEEEVKALIHRADQALYAAKAAGKDRVEEMA